VFFSTPALRAGGPLGHQLHAERRQHLQDCPERWIHVAAKRSVKTCAVDVCLFGNGPHSVGSREVADRSGGKSRIIGRERVIQVLRNNFGLLRNLMASKALALDIGQPPSLFSPSRSILDDLRHSSRFSFRRPQCFSFRGGSNTRSTRRLNALSMPIRAIMVGSPRSAPGPSTTPSRSTSGSSSTSTTSRRASPRTPFPGGGAPYAQRPGLDPHHDMGY
jgi:hypothetical protein